jgi:isopentenyl diphosphate isomerase/L-lactate dehydrogenase-like FMN-dependent dehydrogenase
VPRIDTYDDVRSVARRRLPKMVVDFVEGGAGGEVTLRENRAAIDRLRFDPRWMTDVADRDTSTTVLGDKVALPVLLAPAGLAGLCHRQGEKAAVRAAGAAGTITCLSTATSFSIEEIADAASGPLWFQLYLGPNDETTRGLLDRAKAVGCKALVLTIDTPVIGNRERDVRNGTKLPPEIRISNTIDVLRHPRWLPVFLRDPKVLAANFPNGRMQGFDTTVTWEKLDWLRRLWDGALVVKGVLSARDACEAVQRGADAVYVSNHGGRQLDSSPATFDVLPEIVDAVGSRAEVIVDGGIRRGEDAVKTRALGARACLIGRPWFLALAAGGEAGVRRTLDVLQADVDRTLALVGVKRFDDVTASVLRTRP